MGFGFLPGKHYLKQTSGTIWANHEPCERVVVGCKGLLATTLSLWRHAVWQVWSSFPCPHGGDRPPPARKQGRTLSRPVQVLGNRRRTSHHAHPGSKQRCCKIMVFEACRLFQTSSLQSTGTCSMKDGRGALGTFSPPSAGSHWVVGSDLSITGAWTKSLGPTCLCHEIFIPCGMLDFFSKFPPAPPLVLYPFLFRPTLLQYLWEIHGKRPEGLFPLPSLY